MVNKKSLRGKRYKSNRYWSKKALSLIQVQHTPVSLWMPTFKTSRFTSSVIFVILLILNTYCHINFRECLLECGITIFSIPFKFKFKFITLTVTLFLAFLWQALVHTDFLLCVRVFAHRVNISLQYSSAVTDSRLMIFICPGYQMIDMFLYTELFGGGRVFA